MNNKILLGIVAVVVLIGAGYYMSKGAYKPAVQPTPSTQTAAAPNTVTVNNFAFDPPALTVKVGDTVTWVNQDSVGHTIKGDAFNSPLLQQGEKFTFTFASKGTFNYICSVHPSMKGTITVE